MKKQQIKAWLLAQMQKGRNAEKHAQEEFAKLPIGMQKLIKKEVGYYDFEETTIKGSDLERFYHYARLSGMADFNLIELYLSSMDIGIDLKKTTSASAKGDETAYGGRTGEAAKPANDAPENRLNAMKEYTRVCKPEKPTDVCDCRECCGEFERGKGKSKVKKK